MPTIALKVERKLIVPSVPSHLSVEGTKRTVVSLTELSDTDLTAIGAEWTKNLLEKAKALREAPARSEGGEK